MNSIQLMKYENNGTPKWKIVFINLWQCQCGKVSHTKDIAEKCCVKWICQRCQRSVPEFYTYCSHCRDFFRMEKAEEVKDYTGYIYIEGYSQDFYESLEDFYDCNGDPEQENDFPEFVFCCEEIPFPSFDVDRLLENYIDDFEDGEDAYSRLQGVELLQKALDWFTKKNAGCVSYQPDYKRKVRLK